MVQEEVAQKIPRHLVEGMDFLPCFFSVILVGVCLIKFHQAAFFPPPKVNSRLLYFKPRYDVEVIPDEDEFWRFIKACLQQPRRTMRNNFAQAHYNISMLSQELLNSRAQQLSMGDFIKLWVLLR